VYLPIARRRYPGPSPVVVGPDTEFVIDGYMRSANTYAVYAFQIAQRRPVRLAHHLHAPAQLIEATRRRIPALALIRDPEGAILSQVQWEPDVSMPAALTSYIRFYRALLPFADRFVIATFEDVTEDFGAVVGRVNDRFGTRFDEFERTEPNERLCLELMQERATEIPGWRRLVLGFETGDVALDQLLEARTRFPSAADAGGDHVWSPSASRRRTKETLRETWNGQGIARLRDAATSTYEAFLSAARG
jgi:hypothetical protein